MQEPNVTMILGEDGGQTPAVGSPAMNIMAERAVAMQMMIEKMPGLLPDFVIETLSKPPYNMITPYAPGEKRQGVISYGLSSTGYDVRLGTKFKIFTNVLNTVIDPKQIDERAFHSLEADVCVIPPHSYILGESIEVFNIPRDVTVLCIGKSTYARCGLIVNVTPGEPAWQGRWTIEVSNTSPNPVKVYANEGIMQCLFLRTAVPCRENYADKRGKYQNDTGLQTAKVD